MDVKLTSTSAVCPQGGCCCLSHDRMPACYMPGWTLDTYIKRLVLS